MSKRDIESAVFQRQLLERILKVQASQYQDTEDERRILFEEETEVNDEFPVWAEIELFSGDMMGYASQIINKGYIYSPQETVERLREFSLFGRPQFLSWYLSTEKRYPKLKTFARTLDYIRLQVIEYITVYQSDEMNRKD